MTDRSPPPADAVFDLTRFPVHLGRGATIRRLEEHDGSPEWYERYGAATAADGIEGRLVSMHMFHEPWDGWEVHPDGHELVACISGRLTLHQETDDGVVTVTLGPGEAIVNPPGVWHTADVDEPTTALFVTAGHGTEGRPR